MTADSAALNPVSEPARRATSLQSFTFASYCGAAVCVAAAAWWPGEEPSKLRTMFVALALHAVMVMFLLFAQRRRWLSSPTPWILAFAAKLTLSVVLTYYIWFEPLSPDMMRVPSAVLGSQDSNLYDYYALEAARNGMLRSWDLLNFTWLSFGITTYLASIYTVFGVSIAYVSMCNAVLSIAGLVALSACLRTLFGPFPRWDWIAFAAFIPSVSFYDATPAKEPVTHVFFLSALYALVRLGQARAIRPALLFQVVVTLALLAVVRANVALMLLLANAWPLLRRIGFLRGVVAGAAGALVAIVVLIFVTGSVQNLTSFFDISEKIEKTAGFVQEREEANESRLKLVVARLLAPRSLSHLVVWSPVRATIWFYLPYPLIVPTIEGLTAPPTLLFEHRLAKVSVSHELGFALTGWLLILATPSLIGIAWRVFNPRYPGLAVIASNIAVPALIIGNFMFLMGRRYRTLIEPLVFAAVLVAMHYGFGRRSRWPAYLAMTAGVVLTALLRS